MTWTGLARGDYEAHFSSAGYPKTIQWIMITAADDKGHQLNVEMNEEKGLIIGGGPTIHELSAELRKRKKGNADLTAKVNQLESDVAKLSAIVTGERKDMSSKIPDDIRQRVVRDFGQQRADEIYHRLLQRIPIGLANGTRPRHLCCIVYLAKGDMERLDQFIKMCLIDTRDVMLAAEYETVEGDSKHVRKRDFNKPFDEAQILTK